MQSSDDHRLLVPTSTRLLLQRIKTAQSPPSHQPSRDIRSAGDARKSAEVRRNLEEIRRRYTAVGRIDPRMQHCGAVNNEVSAITRSLARNRVLEVTRPGGMGRSSPPPPLRSRPATAFAERFVEKREEERVESRCSSALPGPERKVRRVRSFLDVSSANRNTHCISEEGLKLLFGKPHLR